MVSLFVLTVKLILLSDVCLGLNYLVSLVPSENIDTFFLYEDSHYRESDRIRSLISNRFSIGNFSAFKGEFSKLVLKRLQKCPMVASVTPDIEVRAFDTVVQDEAPRHLARISQRSKLEPGDNYEYAYNNIHQGKSINAYVLDSGVETEHHEFEGRAQFGIDLTREGPGDRNGHGTHVAGVIGSKTYGVAKKVLIIDVKALDGDGIGSLSTIISAIEFAVKHRQNTGRAGVANLSLGSMKNAVLNSAIKAAVDSGLVIVAAAGNSNENACQTSPASSPYAITVGAIDDSSDNIAPFSNWGECVDIFSSGVLVYSVNPEDPKHPQILSGTSMSSPIITGIVANMLSEGIQPVDIKKELTKRATVDKIPKRALLFRRKSPNRIGYGGVESTYQDLDSDSDSDSDSE